MKNPPEGAAVSGLAMRTASTSGLDTVDTCRIRLLSLRTRIETTWPSPRRHRFARTQDVDAQTLATIAELLRGLPTPLPLHAGAEPEPITFDSDAELRRVPGRAVDAGLALLANSQLDTIYPRQVTMLESRQPVARGSIVVSEPTVGLVVATIIGTLDAVSEVLGSAVHGVPPLEAATVPPAAPGMVGTAAPDASQARPDRGRRVPRI